MPTLTPRIVPLLSGLRTVGAHSVPSLRMIKKARDAADDTETIPPLLPRLVIQMCDSTEDTVVYNRYFQQGQFLSRQENWAELGELIRRFDKQRLKTPGGSPIAQVLAEGARADAVTAAAQAVGNADQSGAQMPFNALQSVLEDHSEDHGVALVIALAHIDIGWAWRGNSWGVSLPTLQKGAFHAHFRSAARIIDRFNAFELDAPTLAAARCALLAAEIHPERRVADDYEDLIDLDPVNTHHMRGLGRHLLPRWFGDMTRLEQEARRTAQRTADHWGAGGYSWVYMGALERDTSAFDNVDAEYFVEGLHDILDRSPTQHTANLWAAFLGQNAAGIAEPGSGHARIKQCFDWVVRDHLREVHPLIWMTQTGDPSRNTPLPTTRDGQKCGRVNALSLLAEHFAPDIRAGNRVVFDAKGITIAPCV